VPSPQCRGQLSSLPSHSIKIAFKAHLMEIRCCCSGEDLEMRAVSKTNDEDKQHRRDCV